MEKLSSAEILTAEDRQLLEGLSTVAQRVPAGQDLIVEGEKPRHTRLFLSGYGCRYKGLASGERSITSLLLPGDFCDLNGFVLGYMDHTIATISECDVAEIPPEAMTALMADSPRVVRALWWATLVDDAIWREWLLNMGRRPADQQLAHLFCETLARLRASGTVRGQDFPFPLTQEQLADVIGVSTVHVNRILQRLRGEELVALEGRRVIIPDPPRLAEFCGFDGAYLHLSQDGFWGRRGFWEKEPVS